MNIVIAVSNINYTKNCGTKPSDFKVIITFLPLSSTPNDNFAWISFKFETQDDIHEIIECVNELNEKHCTIKTNVDLPSRGKLWITSFLSVIGIGNGEFSKTRMTYKQKATDFFCYDDYCIDTQKNITIDKESQDEIEFDVPVTGTIRNNYSIMINNKTVECDSYIDNILKCRFNVNNLDGNNDIYDVYSKQCGSYYKTGIRIVTNIDYNISISYIIHMVLLFLILV